VVAGRRIAERTLQRVVLNTLVEVDHTSRAKGVVVTTQESWGEVRHFLVAEGGMMARIMVASDIIFA
jgi:hypothetical protein